MSKQSHWAKTQRGFKHQLVLALIEDGFSYRKAQLIISTIFEAMKQALLRHEPVELPFGTLRVMVNEPKQARRFGKVITIHGSPYRVGLESDAEAPLAGAGKSRKSYPSRASSSKPKQKLTDSTSGLSSEPQQQHQDDKLLGQCTRIIVKFLTTELSLLEVQLFWTLRWNSAWFSNEAAQVPRMEIRSVSLSNAPRVIEATKADCRSGIWPNDTIDALRWYARWSTRLAVAPDIWKQAERSAVEKKY